MKQRNLGPVLAALAVGAAFVLATSSRRRREGAGSWDEAEAGGARAAAQIDAAPLVEVRGAFDEVVVSAGAGPGIELTGFGVEQIADAVEVRRDEDGRRVVLEVRPRRRLDVFVPPGTALRLEMAQSHGVVYGVDDVDVRCARSRVELRDVAGTIRVQSAKAEVDVDLARDRETRSVDVDVAKSRFALAVPASRGGAYRVETAKSGVTVPPSVEGGIPIAVRAARALVAISAN
ncbi:MAG: hypothetical protein JO103_00185 [Candidatus Eremiobacteraeota bacterium]|nr:hypothetical protein [Candidatus Eremiobacteraeota bacterium]